MRLPTKIRHFTRSIPNRQAVFVVFVVNALILLFIFLAQGSLPPVVPLFYGQPQGASQLAPKLYLLIPPALALATTTINAFLSKATKDDFLWSILLGVSLLVSTLSTITVVKIIFLVGNI